MYTRTHVHTGTQAHRHTGTQAHRHTCTHAHMHTCTHAHMHTCTHAHMHTCTHAHMHTHTHAHMHTCIHAYIHTYIHTKRHRSHLQGPYKKAPITPSRPTRTDHDIEQRDLKLQKRINRFIKENCNSYVNLVSQTGIEFPKLTCSTI